MEVEESSAPGAPRSDPSYVVLDRDHLIGPIRSTRRHTATSPRGDLYYTQCLRCAGAPGEPWVVPGFRWPPCRHAVVQNVAVARLRRDLSGSALPVFPQSVSRGPRLSGLPDSHICDGLHPACHYCGALRPLTNNSSYSDGWRNIRVSAVLCSNRYDRTFDRPSALRTLLASHRRHRPEAFSTRLASLPATPARDFSSPKVGFPRTTGGDGVTAKEPPFV
jgi:hypothetical protein